MKKKEIKKEVPLQPEDWVHFPWAFLDLAEFGCEFWLKAFKEKRFHGKTSTRSYVAIVFNIKHSIELFLKRSIVFLLRLSWRTVSSRYKKIAHTIPTSGSYPSEKNYT